MLQSAPPWLTLLSDFGLSDPYVGILKGTIAQINPHLTIVDLTHDIPPQNLWQAQFALQSAIAYFPAGTVHVAVVDPGVGSQRRAVAVAWAGDRPAYCVAPDNGLLSGLLDRVVAAVELDRPAYWRTPNPSRTFHGRDLFAPVGAHLASGVPLTDLGTAIDPATLVRLDLAYRHVATRLEGCIQAIDRFGNLITTIPGERVQGCGWQVQAGGHCIEAQQTYSDRPIGALLALVGSHGWVEIAVNQGSAYAQLHLDWGKPITVWCPERS